MFKKNIIYFLFFINKFYFLYKKVCDILNYFSSWWIKFIRFFNCNYIIKEVLSMIVENLVLLIYFFLIVNID